MNKNTFVEQIKKLEINYSKKYSEEQLAFLWEELQHMNGEFFMRTIRRILNEKNSNLLPNKADFVNFSDGGAVFAPSRALIDYHFLWEWQGSELVDCICECNYAINHQGLYFETTKGVKTTYLSRIEAKEKMIGAKND